MSLIEKAMGRIHAGQPSAAAVTAKHQFKELWQEIAAADPAVPLPGSPATPTSTRMSDTSNGGATSRIPLVIPLSHLLEQSFITPGKEADRTAREFRMIKRPLLFNLSSRKDPPVMNARRIMVTSALPNEGKTFCAINLALSIADERDHSVLLVDADVARPSLPEKLGVAAQPGLMDALSDPSIEIGDLVVQTSIDNLSLLMAGGLHRKATEMLASGAMNRLLESLSTRFADRIIIFDSPPLLVTTEASVLAAHMGQIVLVVEAGGTDRGAVSAAVACLADAPGIVSTLMNKAPLRKKSEFLPYGGYGYGYEVRA